jgi:hypothetical protein
MRNTGFQGAVKVNKAGEVRCGGHQRLGKECLGKANMYVVMQVEGIGEGAKTAQGARSAA